MPADEGIYVCQAENQAGSISVGASLAVHGMWGFLQAQKQLDKEWLFPPTTTTRFVRRSNFVIQFFHPIMIRFT